MLKFLKIVLPPLPLALVICFLTAHISMQLGDLALDKNQLTKAQIYYKISAMVNPLSNAIQRRLSATNMLLLEQIGIAEESGDTKKLAQNPSKGAYVLGTTTQIPVLMYHYIRVNPDPGDTVGFGLSVTPYNFAAQLDYLSSHGYHTVSLNELGANLLYHTPLPKKPIVLTFDDGYRDFYTAAFPILKEHNMKAVNFIITGFVDLPRYLTWNQIMDMHKSGLVTFAAHTVNHLALTSIADARVLYEITQSRKDLEIHLNYPINWLAYPYGNVNKRVADLAKQVGFIGAFGTQYGTFESTDTMFTEPRVRVGGGDSPQSLGARLPWN